MTHFDRPAPSSEITAILESIMEEKKIDNYLTERSKMNKSPAIQGTPRCKSPSNLISTQNCINPSGIPHQQATQYNSPLDLVTLANQKNYLGTRNVIETGRCKSPILQGDWFPPRPLSHHTASSVSSRPSSSLVLPKKKKKKVVKKKKTIVTKFNVSNN